MPSFKRRGGIAFLSIAGFSVTISRKRSSVDRRPLSAIEYALIGSMAVASLSAIALHTVDAMAASKPVTHARYQYQAIDKAGDLFIAGEGDSCVAAEQGAVLPPNLFYAACVDTGK